MIIKPHTIPAELKILRCLNSRLKLSVKDNLYYLNLEKGNEGEEKFADLLGDLSSDRVILNDLLLECNQTLFQIDTLLISQNTIYLFEVKNYEGDFFIKSGIWYSESGNEISNPVLQLTRCESLFRRLLKDLDSNYTIKPYVIFINQNFTLFQAPLNQPFILPTQLNRFMQKLNLEAPKPNKTHIKFAERLMPKHINESPYTRLPKYDYKQLKKGIACVLCNSFLTSLRDKKLICDSCGCKENLESSALRSVEQFQLLFPDKKITTNIIYDWCNMIIAKRTICRILSKNYTLLGHGRFPHYVNTAENYELQKPNPL